MARQPNCIHLSISKEAAENNGITEWHCDEFDWTEPTFRPSTITGHQERNTELFEQCRGCPRKNDVLPPESIIEEQEATDEDFLANIASYIVNHWQQDNN